MHTNTPREADSAVVRFLSQAGMTACRALQYSPVMAVYMPPCKLPLPRRPRRPRRRSS